MDAVKAAADTAQQKYEEDLAALSGVQQENSDLKAKVTSLQAKLDQIAASDKRKQIPGSYRPDKTSAGVLSDVPRTKVTGNCTPTADGQVIENKWFTGAFIRKFSGVVVKNCQFDGGTFVDGKWYAVAQTLGAVAVPTKFYDCTFTSTVKSPWVASGLQGRDVELYRCDISGSVDGVGAQNGNVKVIACWIHDLPYFAQDIPGGHSNGTHNDGIQLHGNLANYEFVGNSIEMGKGTNAGIMVNADIGSVDNLTISKNWLISDQCASAINFGPGTFTKVTVTDNILSNKATWVVGVKGGNPILLRKGMSATVSGNKYLDGSAVATTSS